MDNKRDHKVICFGEVHWGIFPTGAMAGGTPMQIAYHFQKLRMEPAVISRIGIDKKGEELLQLFSDYNVCTDFFQVDYEHETGRIYVKLNEYREVVYYISRPAAWDYISLDHHLSELVAHAEYFVYGSLVARNNVSRTTLLKLLECAKYKVLDLNLRAPYYDRRLIEELLSRTDLLKLNLKELELITGWFTRYSSLEDRARSILEKFAIRGLIITMGVKGALLYLDGQEFKQDGIKVDIIDTMGSGEAFLAGFLAQLQNHASPADALQFANAMGALIAHRTGPCPAYNLNEIDKLVQSGSIY
jgi:fructokinase